MSTKIRKQAEPISENSDTETPIVESSIVSVEVVTKKAVSKIESEIESIKLKSGQVLFVELDLDGNEKNPSTIGEKTYNKLFANAVHKGTNQPKYQIKKK